LVPGVISGGSQQRGGLVIRGITTRTPEAGADSVVGQYIDEVYQPRITSQFTSLFDLERIEVLKGPQGTLYGRNTIGGVVNYITQRPGQDVDGYFTAGFGNRDLYELRAGVSGPLTSNLAAGVSTMIRSSDGNIDVVDAAGNIIGDDGSSDRGVRIALNWQPSDRLEVNASAFTLRMRGASLDMVDGLPAGVIGPIIASFGLYVPSPYTDDNRNYRIARTTAGRLARDTTEVALRIDFHVTDTMTLTSLTAYQNYDFELVNDFDYDVQQIEQFQTFEDAETFSQEIRLANDGDVFDWTVGAYYFYDDLNHVEMDDFTGGPVAFILPPPYPRSSSTVRTTSAALFGQGNFSITDDLTLTTGIRYSYDERDYRKINEFQFPGFENFDSADQVLYPFWDTDPSWDNISYLVSLDYQVTPDILLYASHSTGYRSGGIQGRSDSALQASSNYDPEHATQFEIGFKSMLFDGRVLLNVAAYHIDYDDAQISQIPLDSPFDIIRNAAGARFQGIEVESRVNLTDELSFHLAYTYNDSEFTEFSDAEDIPGVIAALDFDGDGIPDCPAPLYGCAVGDHIYDGTDFEFAIKHAFVVALDYDGQLNDDLGLSLHAEYAWRDSHLLTPLPQNVASRSNAFLNSAYLRQSSYGLLNASASLNIGDHWSVGIWGRNLTNERYLTQGGDPQPAVNGFPSQTFLQGDRRTYGLTIGWHY
jgi:iron complex outermembrane receptor protein